MIEILSSVRNIGEKLFLKFQLFDRATGKRVFCTVRDQNNAIIFPRFELPFLQDGFYEETDKVMPDRPEIKAFFEVTESDGITDADYFYVYSLYTLPIVSETESLRGSIALGNNKLTGIIKEHKLTGKLKCD